VLLPLFDKFEGKMQFLHAQMLCELKELAHGFKWFQQVFEKLGPSLYDFLRKNSYRSFPIDLVRELGRQLLESVAYMHDLRLIHTDLKPENILLVSSEYIKIPDYKVSNQSSPSWTHLFSWLI
jgi:serine/threonine protein kinase